MSVLIQLPHRCCIWLKPNRRLEKEGLIYLKVDTMCSLSSLNIGNLADFFNTKNMLDNSGTCLQRGFWSVANMIYKAKVYLGNTKKKKKKNFWAVQGHLERSQSKSEQHIVKVFMTPMTSLPGGGWASKEKAYFSTRWEGSRPNT